MQATGRDQWIAFGSVLLNRVSLPFYKAPNRWWYVESPAASAVAAAWWRVGGSNSTATRRPHDKTPAVVGGYRAEASQPSAAKPQRDRSAADTACAAGCWSSQHDSCALPVLKCRGRYAAFASILFALPRDPPAPKEGTPPQRQRLLHKRRHREEDEAIQPQQ